MPRGIRARIFAAFAVLLAVLGGATVSALDAHESVHAELDALANAERGVEVAMRLASAVRDQYAHQAHTVILDDRSHLELYEASRAAVDAALADAEAMVTGEAEQALLGQIAAASKELDRLFVEEMLPRIPGGARELAGPNGAGMAVVARIVELTDRLTAQLQSYAESAHERAEAADRAFLWRAGAFVFLGALCAVALGIYLDRSIAGPIHHLEGAAERLGAGDLSVRVPEDRDDELGTLARRFNEMARELALRQEQLVQSEKLAGVGRLAAGVAHEINNPLAVILGYARLLARSEDGQVAGDAKAIAEEAERCSEIVEGLLTISRPTRLRASRIELAALLEEVAGRLPAADGAAVSIRGDAVVEADAGKLRQIFSNLVRNACEAAPGEAVEVAIEADGTTARVRIADSGRGVPPADRSRLFEPFFTTKATGTGLGLAVSAALAAAHGGAIELVESERGATFEVRLPLAGVGREEAA